MTSPPPPATSRSVPGPDEAPGREPEIPLAGGNAAAGVVRVGETVRKPWTSHSPGVLALMGTLRAELATVLPRRALAWPPISSGTRSSGARRLLLSRDGRRGRSTGTGGTIGV